MKNIIPLVSLLMAIAIFASPALANPLPDKPHIYVEGSAEVEVAPDQMTIIVGLSETNPKIAVAKEDVDSRSRRLINACKKLGIAAENIKTTALHVSPAFEYRGGEQVSTGTRVYRQVDITLKDLEKYSALIAALIDADISHTVDTKLEVSDEKALADQALMAAVEDARKRAEGIAGSLGRKLGPVHSISEFNTRDDRPMLFSPRGAEGRTGLARTEMAFDQGQSGEPFEPGLIVTSAEVYVVFLIR